MKIFHIFRRADEPFIAKLKELMIIILRISQKIALSGDLLWFLRKSKRIWIGGRDIIFVF